MKFAVKLIAFASVLAASWVHALPDDRSKPIEIQANSAERDAKTGVTTYTGNVDIQQGSIHISAGTVVLDSKNNELTQINASGSPATYHQQLTGPDDVVEAQANTIHFDVAKDLITLLGNSSLKQQSGNISGERIEYDIKTERVKAQAAVSGSTDNSKRITVVIPPSKKSSSNSTSTAKEKQKP
ncbi:MAG TPA: lipopolysaccharide transport periplasmic protein LptA [Pseudomonadales bacterium]|nr:lipopolysaccharide transport periplasmic protein LptA [Pseudomonadales bacterium]